MTDQAAKYTDEELEKLEKKIKQIYSEAQKDIQKKLKDYESKFVTKSEMYMKQVDEGKITWDQYSAWLDGQIFQGEQWEAKRDQIIGIIQDANKQASNILNGKTIDVFAENANWSHYEMENGEGVNFGFGLYDAHAVTNLIKEDPQILPKWKVNEKKDYTWNKKKVNNAITQGIIQGERLDQITQRLVTGLKANNLNTMLTFARTAMTGAQNAGRYQGLMDAKDLGIDVVKVWMATLDDHTRVSHQEIDGEEQKVGDKWHPFKFSNGCRYPGDPLGPPHEVYNCRCTLVSDIKDYPSKFKRYDNIEGKPIDEMTYKEWKEAKSETPQIEESEFDDALVDELLADTEEEEEHTFEDPFEEELQEILNDEDLYNEVEKWSNFSDFYNYGAYTLEDEGYYLDEDQLKQLWENVHEPIVEKESEELIANIFEKYKDMKLTDALKSLPKDVAMDVSKQVYASKGDHTAAEYWKMLTNGTASNEEIENLLNSSAATAPLPVAQWIEACKNNPNVSEMLQIEEKNFSLYTEFEKDSLRMYTGSSYSKMNDYLRRIGAGETPEEARQNSRIRDSQFEAVGGCHSALNDHRLERDMVLRRGTDFGDLAGLFMTGDFYDNTSLLEGKTVEELNAMFQGQVGTYFGFTSTSSQWDRGFDGNVEVILNAPAGTAAASIMKISQFGTGEGETLLRDNTTVVCEKIEKSDGHQGSSIRVFLTIIPD